MLFAIVSDIHANLPAWKAVLKDIRSHRAESILCLGDIVGYGPMPLPVLEDVYAHASEIVLGNHDAVVCKRFDADDFSDKARAVIDWTRNQLNDDVVKFFSELPTVLQGDDFVIAHAELAMPERFAYVEDEIMARETFAMCDTTMVFLGHTHRASIFIFDSDDNKVYAHPAADFSAVPGMRYIVNVGSVGDPRNPGDVRACYCLYDSDTKEVTYRHVPFDLGAYRLSLKKSGLQIYPYFLSSIDGHPDVIQTQDWKPRLSMVRSKSTARGIKLSRGAISQDALREEQSLVARKQKEAEEVALRADLARKQKLFRDRSLGGIEKERKDREHRQQRLKDLQFAATLRREKDEQERKLAMQQRVKLAQQHHQAGKDSKDSGPETRNSK